MAWRGLGYLGTAALLAVVGGFVWLAFGGFQLDPARNEAIERASWLAFPFFLAAVVAVLVGVGCLLAAAVQFLRRR